MIEVCGGVLKSEAVCVLCGPLGCVVEVFVDDLREVINCQVLASAFRSGVCEGCFCLI